MPQEPTRRDFLERLVYSTGAASLSMAGLSGLLGCGKVQESNPSNEIDSVLDSFFYMYCGTEPLYKILDIEKEEKSQLNHYGANVTVKLKGKVKQFYFELSKKNDIWTLQQERIIVGKMKLKYNGKQWRPNY